jgi:hypothetical protein
MPGSGPLDAVPLWVLAVALVAASLLVGELGFGLGRVRSSPLRKESEAAVGTAVAAELGLLALLRFEPAVDVAAERPVNRLALSFRQMDSSAPVRSR